MSSNHSDLEFLLSKMPEIAEAVNRFPSEESQLLVLKALLATVSEEESAEEPDLDEGISSEESTRAEKPPAPSKGKSGGKKPASFTFLEKLFDAESGRKLKEFFDAKQPKHQNDQVLVVLRGMQTILNLQIFSYDEIFTALRTVGTTIPKSMSGVIGNLRIATLITGDKDAIKLHFTAEDHVDKKLPATTKK